ncbi:phage portal protein [Ahrensia marina]|uniref:DUF1073 domain-containing protein n=1 Tax=Ahrensia marina TaxID=1514904 RepID=UPI0035CF6FAF
MTSLFDGLRNLVSGLGSSRDKASAASYNWQELDAKELRDAYRSSWLAKKIVDIPAQDAVRDWREWQAQADQISEIEAEEKRLGVQAKVRQAQILARLYGGAAIYIATSDRSPEKPLDPTSIRTAGIEALVVVSRHCLSAYETQDNTLLPGYGEPSLYTVEGGVFVHPSRLVVFDGAALPDPDMRPDGWGDSVLQTTLDAVKATDSVAANILSLTYEAKVDVVKVPRFTEGLRSGGPAYEKAMLDRWRLAMAGKGINGALMIDAEEEYQQKTLSFASIPDVWDRFMITVSGASDIPVTRLFGRAPAGMNATGEADTSNYYDMVKGIQTGSLQPAMAILDECLIHSALGARPDEVFYNWRPLQQPSAKERAEVADKTTSAFERVHRMTDLVPEEPLGKALINALTESGIAPGLEADVDEYFAGDREDEDDPDPALRPED